MRFLHLVDRLGRGRPATRDLIAALAERHSSFVAAGRIDADGPLACETRRVEGLCSVGASPVAAALDAVVDTVAPEVIVLHEVVNPEALAWVGRRGGVVVVNDLRAFHPERGIGVPAMRPRATGGERPVLCADCFETDPYFQRVRAESRSRLGGLATARAVLVATDAAQRELAALGVTAPLVVLSPDPEERASWLAALT